MKAAEVAGEMTGVVPPDERHHLLDRKERALEQLPRAQQAQRSQVPGWRRADLAMKQVREPRGGKMDRIGERVDRQRGPEPLFDLYQRRRDPRVHPVA
jgi:hypothetical protein